MTIVIAICGLWMLGAGPAIAAGRSVAEEILDILRANGQITEQQYGVLLEKARSEQQTLPAVSAAEKPETFRAYWNKGIRLESADKRFKMKLGGRLMQDWEWTGEDSDIESVIGDQANNTEFRRARFYVEGLIYERIKFKAQYDFGGGDVDFKDTYLELQKIPRLGNLRVGHFKEPYSLEELTSSKYIPFMERSLPNLFSPGRNSGVMLHNHAFDKRMTWAVGGFRDTDDFAESDDSEGSDDAYHVTARLTGLPWYADEGERLLHVGLSYSHKFREDDSVRFRQRPEQHMLDRFVDTGSILTDGVDLVTPELALVCGPFSLQGEYTKAFVEGSSFDFDSYYVQASYFLTGEHRKYKQTAGAFSRVSPREDFDMKGGLGAWEVGVRYSWVDLDDNIVSGGELDDITVGLNWHLNPNVRVMLNYVRADLDGVGDADIFQTRFQVDF
jgi:phosphate-selective porin OprO/OprP